MTSRDQHGLSLVPTGAGTTEEVPVSGLVVGVGQWSHDGGRLWITARQKDQVRVQLFPVDVVSRKLLEPIAGSNVSNAPIAISPDDQWIAAVGADGAVTVYPIQKGEPVRISSVRADLFPNLAGWTTTGELWVFLAGATPSASRPGRGSQREDHAVDRPRSAPDRRRRDSRGEDHPG